MNKAEKREGKRLAAEMTASNDQRRAELAQTITTLAAMPGGPSFLQSIALELCQRSPDVMRRMGDTELQLVAAMAEQMLSELCAGVLQQCIESAGG